MELNKLRDKIHENAKAKGFWDNPREIGTLLMLIVSELSEALEADRKQKYANNSAFYSQLRYSGLSLEDFNIQNPNYEWIKTQFELYIKDSFEDELVDTIIRILDICGSKNIDIEKHIELKMKYNATRERLHGKKY